METEAIGEPILNCRTPHKALQGLFSVKAGHSPTVSRYDAYLGAGMRRREFIAG